MAVRKTRAQWAAQIRALHRETVRGVFKMGRALVAAKRKLPHGEFLAMVENDLPFGKRTAQMLMAVAADTRLAKANRGSLLPATWRVLYELTKLPDARLEQALASGAINQQTTRDNVRALFGEVSTRPLVAYPLPNPVVYGERTIVAAPIKVTIAHPVFPRNETVDIVGAARPVRANDETADLCAVSTTLREIERLVGELKASVERGEVVVDAAFSLRAQSAADVLMAMAARYTREALRRGGSNLH